MLPRGGATDQVCYLVGESHFCGDQLQVSIVLETETDSDLLINAQSLQAEETTAEGWRPLQEVE